MPSLNISVAHNLGQPDALARVTRFLDEVQRNYAAVISDPQGEWVENRLQFRFLASGLAISGTLVVEETLVHVSGPLPLAAAFFRGRIERTIREELERLLS